MKILGNEIKLLIRLNDTSIRSQYMVVNKIQLIMNHKSDLREGEEYFSAN